MLRKIDSNVPPFPYLKALRKLSELWKLLTFACADIFFSTHGLLVVSKNSKPFPMERANGQ